MKIIGVIPARYDSSRFPGKPLADICGKPMIWWVYAQASKVKEFDEVYVATDDDRIFSECEKYEMKVIMTSKTHLTGTDRVAEVSEKVNADIIVNIQGDEPLLSPDVIEKPLKYLLENKEIKVVNLMSKINNPVEVVNNTIPKVVVNKDNFGVFLSRSAIPYPKGIIDFCYYKQVCVYAFRKDALTFFANSTKGQIEKVEDIEILRFIENNILVKFLEVESNSIAVDTNKDLEKVRNIISNKIEKGEISNE